MRHASRACLFRLRRFPVERQKFALMGLVVSAHSIALLLYVFQFVSDLQHAAREGVDVIEEVTANRDASLDVSASSNWGGFQPDHVFFEHHGFDQSWIVICPDNIVDRGDSSLIGRFACVLGRVDDSRGCFVKRVSWSSLSLYGARRSLSCDFCGGRRSVSVNARAALLHNMSEFMSEQTLTLGCAGFVLAGTEYYLLPHGIR